MDAAAAAAVRGPHPFAPKGHSQRPDGPDWDEHCQEQQNSQLQQQHQPQPPLLQQQQLQHQHAPLSHSDTPPAAGRSHSNTPAADPHAPASARSHSPAHPAPAASLQQQPDGPATWGPETWAWALALPAWATVREVDHLTLGLGPDTRSAGHAAGSPAARWASTAGAEVDSGCSGEGPGAVDRSTGSHAAVLRRIGRARPAVRSACSCRRYLQPHSELRCRRRAARPVQRWGFREVVASPFLLWSWTLTPSSCICSPSALGRQGQMGHLTSFHPPQLVEASSALDCCRDMVCTPAA